MIMDLAKCFKNNTEATYITQYGDLCLQSVDREGNIRKIKANEQKSYPPIVVEKVVDYINEFFNLFTGCINNEERIINLDSIEHKIVGSCILAKKCKWETPLYDKKKRKYVFYDKKYDIIKSVFSLDYPNDIVWLKFTDRGYIGVVADSFDINFDYNTSSGKLIKHVGQLWDQNLVVIIPITPKMKELKSRKEIETGLGNYLENRGVPIIDYYSHNNF